ncbi:MAG: Rrf2 family transcriptional regulator [Actinomycetota bacterium]
MDFRYVELLADGPFDGRVAAGRVERCTMKFSTRARYGMRAMLDIALYGDGGLVLLREIAERQDISKRYLEHMMTMLRNGGLVVAERGAGGGYRLARPAERIRLDEIFEALEGDIATVECVRDGSACERAESCVTRVLWTEVSDAIRSVLERRTLADLAESCRSMVKG